MLFLYWVHFSHLWLDSLLDFYLKGELDYDIRRKSRTVCTEFGKKELMKEYEEHPEYGQTSYLVTIPTPHAKQAYLAGTEPKEKRIAELKQ